MIDYDSDVSQKKGASVYDLLSSKFSEQTLDIREIAKQSNDPFFVSLLLFKLAEEREKTNKLLADINDKFDKMFIASQEQEKKTVMEVGKASLEVLPETDQRILDFIERKGMGSANEIMVALNSKAQNAASQRLNKLFREGH